MGLKEIKEVAVGQKIRLLIIKTSNVKVIYYISWQK